MAEVSSGLNLFWLRRKIDQSLPKSRPGGVSCGAVIYGRNADVLFLVFKTIFGEHIVKLEKSDVGRVRARLHETLRDAQAGVESMDEID